MSKLDNLKLNDTISYETIVYDIDQSTVTLELKGNILTYTWDTISADDITSNLINKILKFDEYEPVFGECILIVRNDKWIKTFLCWDDWLVFIYEYID